MTDANPATPASTTAILVALADLTRQVLELTTQFRQQQLSPLATFDFEKN